MKSLARWLPLMVLVSIQYVDGTSRELGDEVKPFSCSQLVFQASLYTKNPSRARASRAADNFQYVRIDAARIEAVAPLLQILVGDTSPPSWNWPPYLEKNEDFEDLFAFFLVLNSINYKYFVSGSHQEFHDGHLREAELLATRISQNWEHLKANRFQALVQMNEKFLSDDLFKAEVPLTMFSERIKALREVGNFLNQYHNPKKKVWESTLHRIASPASLALGISKSLPTWDDPYLKRAQLFTFMLLGRARSLKMNLFAEANLNDLTVAADYILPKVLIQMGILHENPLRKFFYQLRGRDEIPKGSLLEDEIRAATVISGDRLAKAMAVTIPVVDALLWSIGTGHADKQRLDNLRSQLFTGERVPYHQTETTDY